MSVLNESSNYVEDESFYNTATGKMIQDGKDEYSDGTSECTEYPGCIYQLNGRCIYNVARVQQAVSRACNEDDKLYLAGDMD